MSRHGISDTPASVGTGRMVILIDRESYWQTVFHMSKGSAGPMTREGDPDRLLAKVQQRREFPTRIIQRMQKIARWRVVDAVLSGRPIDDAPLPVRLLDRYPVPRRIPGRLVGLGMRRESVRSPGA